MVVALLSIIPNISDLLSDFLNTNVGLAYLGLFVLIFIETGVVILPFLPGDSILFLCGSLVATTGAINPWLLIGLLSLAAILGDWLNFEIGKRFGGWLIKTQKLQRVLQPKHLAAAANFFAKHGNVAIFLGRFVPIIRTLVPFTAGMSSMSYPVFAKYNLLGGITWVSVVIGAGFFFGNLPLVKANFELIMIAIVLISLLPVAWGALKSRKS